MKRKLIMSSVNKLIIAMVIGSLHKAAGMKIYNRLFNVSFLSFSRLFHIHLSSVCRLFPICLPSFSHLFIIRLPFNFRLSSVMLPYCCRCAVVPGSSNKKNYNRSFGSVPVIKRMFESNQFNNLSPPHKHSANKISNIKLTNFLIINYKEQILWQR